MASKAGWALASALTITLAVVSLSCACPPAPSIASVSPVSATAGGSEFVLTVNGDDFRHDSVVKWNSSPLVTTFGSSHQLLAAVTATDIAQPGTVLVFVFNPPEGGSTTFSGAIGVTSTTSCSGKNSNGVTFTAKP
jgi:hypothetical protein